MKYRRVSILLPFILICAVFTEKTESYKPYYTAAVFEHHYSEDGNPLNSANANVAKYLNAIYKAADYNADIIVFPEGGVLPFGKWNRSQIVTAATTVPDPKDNIILCDNAGSNVKEYLIVLSCAAKSTSMYIVTNVYEKMCNVDESCLSGDIILYNTDVVFDRDGRLISRYRKINLYSDEITEYNISKPHDLTPTTFTTDFNVTFGMFTCFDILFKIPVQELLKKYKVTDIVFPTFWFSQLPFLTSIQVQFGFAYNNNVNLLAANINYLSISSTGSGIYAGVDGPLIKHHSEQTENILLLANVPKRNINDSNKQEIKRFPVYEILQDDISKTNISNENSNRKWLHAKLDAYTTMIYEPSLTEMKKTICNNKLCCHFNIISRPRNISENDQFYRYRMVVYQGTTRYGIFNAGTEICGIISCVNDTLNSCGYLINENIQEHNIHFIKLKITRSVDSENLAFMPSVLTTSLNIPEVDTFKYSHKMKESKTQLKLKLTKPRNDILTFAIYCRDFSKDENFDS